MHIVKWVTEAEQKKTSRRIIAPSLGTSFCSQGGHCFTTKYQSFFLLIAYNSAIGVQIGSLNLDAMLHKRNNTINFIRTFLNEKLMASIRTRMNIRHLFLQFNRKADYVLYFNQNTTEPAICNWMSLSFIILMILCEKFCVHFSMAITVRMANRPRLTK